MKPSLTSTTFSIGKETQNRLRHEKVSYVLDEPVPEKPADNAAENAKAKYEKNLSDSDDATCIMLASMTSELQKQHESMDAYTIIGHLKELYASQSRTEMYEVSKALFSCKMVHGSPVGSHMLKMIGYIEWITKLGHKLERELCIDLILQSLPDAFSQFVMNYHMNKIDCSLAELLNMLKTAEGTVRKGKQVLLVTSSKGKNKVSKKTSKNKAKAAPKAKPNIAKDKNVDVCFHCCGTDHWRRNCNAFLASKKKHCDVSGSGTKKS